MKCVLFAVLAYIDLKTFEDELYLFSSSLNKGFMFI